MRTLVTRTIFLILLSANFSLGDERVREVQEELRRRNLYFGDVDGQATPELSNALRRYQARKGFDVTGAIDDATATSLEVKPRAGAMAGAPPLPDLPVLKSDSARDIPEPQRIALERQAEANPDPPSSPPPPAEAPSPAQNITPERIHAYVEQYLRDGETADIAAQVKYFAYPLEYFDHGHVNAAYVAQDVANYLKRWPERKYTLAARPTFAASATEGETIVEFPIIFDVRNKNHAARGRTRNTWTIRQQEDDLKIVAIREQRLRE